jgi:hypothetical protein
MASHIHIEVSGPVSEEEVRDQLRQITEDSISQSSPITAGVPEAGVYGGTDSTVHVRVQGHSGDWTRTSQTEMCETIRSVHPDVDTAVVSGGFESTNGE